jgi:hypothetical protein
VHATHDPEPSRPAGFGIRLRHPLVEIITNLSERLVGFGTISAQSMDYGTNLLVYDRDRFEIDEAMLAAMSVAARR